MLPIIILIAIFAAFYVKEVLSDKGGHTSRAKYVAAKKAAKDLPHYEYGVYDRDGFVEGAHTREEAKALQETKYANRTTFIQTR